MNHHDNDGAMIAQLMAAFDEVEAAEQRAGLAASTDEVDNGRAFIAAAAQYMFKQSRTPAMAREVLEALLAAVRVRIAAELPKDQIRKLESEFAWTFRFTGAELDALERLMQPAERIVEIKPREVITDRRSIARADLPGPRLATFTEERWKNYLRNFPSEATLAEVEHKYEVDQRAREAAR